MCCAAECPFAHEGEKATRRCPALYLYSSIVCPDVRQVRLGHGGAAAAANRQLYMLLCLSRPDSCALGSGRLCWGSVTVGTGWRHAMDMHTRFSFPIMLCAAALTAPCSPSHAPEEMSAPTLTASLSTGCTQHGEHGAGGGVQ